MAYKTLCDQWPAHPSNFIPCPCTSFTMAQLHWPMLGKNPGYFHLRAFHFISSAWNTFPPSLHLDNSYSSFNISWTCHFLPESPPNKLSHVLFSFTGLHFIALITLHNEIFVCLFAFQLFHTTPRLRGTRIMTLEVTAKNPALTQCSAWHTEDTKTEVLNKYSQCLWGGI